MCSYRDTRDLPLLAAQADNIVLFHPFVPEAAIASVTETLKSRWIGQGPKVDRFEQVFVERLGLTGSAVALGSGTDGLHLAYLLAGLQPNDEVVAPVFTCTATNLPLLYLGVRIQFADIEPDTLNIDPQHVRQLVTDRTKAIVCVHYGGLPCNMDALHEIANERGIPVIEDAAQALGATYHGRRVGNLSPLTVFSFQATKHITTGDGGMLIVHDDVLRDKARRVRWFGIDRAGKQGGYWENDIREVGYKYQMTDIAAAMGLAGLAVLDQILDHRRQLLREYVERLEVCPGLQLIGNGFSDREHAAWLCTVAVDRRRQLEMKLRDNHIESGQVHFRNDRYSVFARFRNGGLPNMDQMDDRYMVLPLHNRMTVEDVARVCRVIQSGW